MLPYTRYYSNSFKKFNLVNPHENNSYIIIITTVPSIFQVSSLRAKKVTELAQSLLTDTGSEIQV